MNRPAHSRRTFARAAIALAVVCGTAATLVACNVPVFRYALERWRPDPYRITVFNRGPLPVTDQTLLRPLEDAADKSALNATVRVVDSDKLDDEADRALFAALKSPESSWLVMQYPKGLRVEKPIWSGPLASDAVTRLTASPLRAELVKRLADGQTAVWLMLECDDAAKNDAVAKQLESELKQLSTKLELPDLTSAPEDNLLSDAPLKVAFSLLRVPRKAEAEQSLVEMLLRSEADLLEFSEPMVFPVFGRGRALLPLIGAGITADNIQDSASFLVGACSCEIKELNPGFDLLLAADWDVLLFKEAPPPEVLAARAVAPGGPPELVAIPPGAAAGQTVASADAEESVLEFEYRAVGLKTLAFIGLALAAIVFLAFKRFA